MPRAVRVTCPQNGEAELHQQLASAASKLAADYGYCVFPLQPDDVLPAVRWVHASAYSGDPGYVYDDWLWCHNIGITCGPSRIVVIDTDRHNADGVEEWHQILEKETGSREFPHTYTVKSRTGYHFYFDDPHGRWRNSCEELAPGIDVRAVGGMVVAAGSVRGDFTYQPVCDVEPAEPPAWLVKRLNYVENTRGNGQKEPRRPDQYPSPPASKWSQAQSAGEYRASRRQWAKRPMVFINRDIDRKVGELAAAPPGERNLACYKAACYIAPAIHRLNRDLVIRALIGAMTKNGAIADDGRGAAMRSILSGLATWEAK